MTLESRTGQAPERLDLPFTLKAIDTRRDDAGEAGVFEGLAATFGERDLLGDALEPGAFRDSLTRPERVKMLWQHDARAPIGVWERLVETEAGLAVRGRLILEVRQAREALALLRAGAVDALSIGFSVPKGGARFERDRTLRRIARLELWEISVVTFPANPKARIGRIAARAAGAGLPSERDFERLLTRDAGFSRSQARTVLRSGFRALHAKQDAGGGLDELALRLRRIAAQVAADAAAPGTRTRR